MRNNKPIPRNELKCGMRVKIPWQGNYYGSKKNIYGLKELLPD